MQCKHKTSFALALLTAASLVLNRPAAATTFTYTTLNAPGAPNNTRAFGVNDAGQVAGYYVDNTGYHGFLETGGTYTTLDVPGAKYGTYAFGVNNAGQVAGPYQDSTGNHGFLETNGAYTTLNDPSATNGTFASGVNDAGQVAGYYQDSTGYHGFLATPNAAPEPSQFVGLSFVAFGALGLILKARKRRNAV